MQARLQPSRPMTRARFLQSHALSLMLIALVFLHGPAMAQEPKREIFLPAAGKGAVVIVVSGISGPALYKDYSAKLAGLGYYTVLVDGNDILVRTQDGRGSTGAENLRKIIADAQTAPQASGRKVALVGFSLGGGGVLLHGAPLMDLVSAVVAYYPAITSMGPDMVPLASRIRVPVLLLSGEQDRYFNCCLIESMRALASAAKANHAVFELVAYPGANHGFNLNVPTHRADDANDAWGKTISFLRRLHPPFVQ